jgi:mono/diheme cytochrome c family protein
MRALCNIGGMLLLISCVMFGQSVPAFARPAAVRAVVTPVAGESWLKHIGRPFETTSMGKTWRLGPITPLEPGGAVDIWQLSLPERISQTKTLSGSDIYRLNCRSCHRESGTGFMPEINSLIDPVRATSSALIMQRMKNVGMTMSRKQARELAGQAEAALLQRIHSGGQEMPAFAYLSEAEVQLLIPYLGQLAGIPRASSNQLVVQESSVEVGEHIVKSVCHICHDASGPNPTAEQLEAGVIPPLSSLVRRTSLSEFVRKVTHGAPIFMGNPATPHAGRMPVLDYLTPDEVAGVYLYLVLYPPGQPQAHDAMPQSFSASIAGVGFQSGSRADPPAVWSLARSESPDRASEASDMTLLIGAVSLISLLLAGSAVLTTIGALAVRQTSDVPYARRAMTLALRLRRPVTVMAPSGQDTNSQSDEVA